MNNNRLGCLSPLAILAALLTLVFIAGYSYFNRGAMFTAGALNAMPGRSTGGVRSHAEIGTDCARCHPAPWEKDTLGDRCQRCHTDVSAQLADPASMHGIMLKNNPTTCQGCHTEHRGAEAALTEMTSRDFPHHTTGYSLASHSQPQASRSITCVDCHAKDITHFDPAVCASCHQKLDAAAMRAHISAYGSGCRGCHDGVETIGKRFDHSLVLFKLEGEHQGLGCEKCHLNARLAADFKSLTVDCANCHQQDEPHNGEFGRDCGMCHRPSGWEPSSFDHNLDTFKLEGKHAGAQCGACHSNKVFKGTPSTCFACHQKDDDHQGKFGQDCGACHKPAGWKPATFDHNLSDFKLTGAHTILACEKCHLNGDFKGTTTTCSGCHADPAFHLGLFRNQACSACHNTSSFVPAIFNLPHPEPSNVEEGGSGINHGGGTCRDCHTTNLMSATCTKCHQQTPGGEGGGHD
ncbi:MAG TPA: cytochrome c3 family protein [Anaerolineales bacterium]|jgi:hypothetical protein